MTQEVTYTYHGTNGTITSPVYLKGIPSVKSIRLTAGPNKQLTNGKLKVKTIVVSEENVDSWTEI